MQALTNEQVAHFRKRRKQLVLSGAAIAAIIVGAALLLFQRDLAAAKLQQEWALWRDDHCTRKEGAPSSEGTGAYNAQRLSGVPGTWACDDGRAYSLRDSDQAPAGWRAAERP